MASPDFHARESMYLAKFVVLAAEKLIQRDDGRGFFCDFCATRRPVKVHDPSCILAEVLARARRVVARENSPPARSLKEYVDPPLVRETPSPSLPVQRGPKGPGV